MDSVEEGEVLDVNEPIGQRDENMNNRDDSCEQAQNDANSTGKKSPVDDDMESAENTE